MDKHRSLRIQDGLAITSKPIVEGILIHPERRLYEGLREFSLLRKYLPLIRFIPKKQENEKNQIELLTPFRKFGLLAV